MRIFFIPFSKIIVFMILILGLTTILAFNISSSENYHKKVVVDAGHGGIDPGTNRGNVLEKDINLAIAKNLTDFLKNKNIEVIMTRTDDSLYQNDRNKDIIHRVEIANKSQADLMVSIHVNSFPSSESFGGQAFYAPNSKSGKKIADCIQKELINIQPDNRRQITSAPYYVLRKTEITAVLIEVGFISNPQDKKRIRDPQQQTIIAEAIGEGILNYFRQNLNSEQEAIKSLVKKIGS